LVHEAVIDRFLVAEEAAHVPVNPPVPLRPERLQMVIGCEIPNGQVEDILLRLGMTVDWDGAKWTVTAPSARFDIAIEEDLIEEIARIYGYDAIPEAPVGGEHAPGTSRSHRVSVSRVRESLLASGYQEAINYSFVDHQDLEKLHHNHMVLPLANPLTSDLDVMRTTLAAGLLNSLSRNLRRQQGRVRLFETGVAFLQGESMNEVERVAAVATGQVLPEQWGVNNREIDFFDIKGDVERLFSLKGLDGKPEFVEGNLPWMHPGAGAIVKVDGKHAGWCGAIHPTVLKGFDIKKSVYAFEIDLEPLLSREVPYVKETSRFPSVRRDIAVLLPIETGYVDVEKVIKTAAGPYLENTIVFDVYAGNNLKDGYKSLAIGLIFNNVSSTLRDEDVDPAIEAVVSELENRLGAQLRG
jgi:phenylalanyl-tRNA synthetase beta chain